MIDRLLAPGPRGLILSALALCAISLAAAWQLQHLRVDRGDERLIAIDDPGWVSLKQHEKDFGGGQTVLIYLRSKDLWSTDRLRAIQGLEHALSGIPGVIRVKSLFGATNIRDKGEFVDAGPLIGNLPTTGKELQTVRDDALYGPLIRGQFLSQDGLATAIYVSHRGDAGNPDQDLELFKTIENLLTPLRSRFDTVFQLGRPRLNYEIDRGLRADMKRTVPLAVGMLAVVVTLFLRTPRVVPIPLITAAITILWTLGFMATVGIPITLLTAILPALIIVVGSVEDVHITAAYMDGLQSGDATRRMAMTHMAHHVGAALLITTGMNVLGFACNVATDIPLIREFSIAAAFAMAANCLTTLLAMPLLLLIFGPRHSRLKSADGIPRGLIGSIVRGVETLSAHHGRKVIVGFAIVVGVVSARIGDLRVDNDPMAYFDPQHPFVRDAMQFHQSLAGLQTFSVSLHAENPGWFKTVEGLRALAEAQRIVDGQALYDRTTSLVDLMALMHQEMHKGDKNYHTAPSTQTDYDLYLSEMPQSELASLVTEDFTTAQIIVRHNLSDSVKINDAIDELQRVLPALLAHRATASFSGKNLMVNRAAQSLMSGELQSLLLMLTVVFLLFSFLYTSWRAGLLALVPNTIPILLNFGVMAWLDVPLNPGTAMIAAIAIGLAVDDTIHLMTRFGAESRRLLDENAAVLSTIRAESVPVVTAAIALASGFAVFGGSSFRVIVEFGLLAAATMLYAGISDLLLMPVLLRHLRLATLWDIISLQVDPSIIKRCALFAGMSQYQVKKLILLSDCVEFQPGESVVRQGEISSGMYVILKGRVDILFEQDGGGKKKIDQGGPGDTFGEVGFSGEKVPRTATVQAASHVTAVRLDALRAQKGLRFYPGIAIRLYRNIGVVLGGRLMGSHRRLVEEQSGHQTETHE